MKIAPSTLAIVVLLCGADKTNTAGEEQSANEQNTGVVNHLHRIYQQPPPLQKQWPPTTLNQWKKHRPHYQAAVQRMLNLPPDSKKQEWPLNLRFTKPDLRTPGVTVKYLAYQSRPKFWVTANLYLPNHATLPAPTIMILHGHSKGGKATEYYQVLIHNLVRKGYVVIFKDGIGFGEREYAGHYYRKKSPFPFMSGMSIPGLETWDNIRTLDLLCSAAMRPWVDAERIGVAGVSGGSMQTFYLALVDDRVKAAAPVCSRNTFTAEFKLWGHCICCVCATGIRRTAEQYHALATFAPRPVIICSGTTDKNHPLEGARKLVSEANQVYALYGKEENLRLVVDDVGHVLSPKFRQEVYGLFNRSFGMKADASDESATALTKAQLDCGLPEESTATIASLVYEASQHLPPDDGLRDSRPDFERYRRRLMATIRNDVFGYHAYMPNRCALDPSSIDKKDRGSFIAETVSYESETSVRLLASLSYPKADRRAPVIIDIDNQRDDVWEFTQAGFAVCTVQLRPNDGDSRRYGDNWGVWSRGMSCGKPSTGMRIYDVLRSIDYIETRDDVLDTGKIGCIGRGSSINAMYGLYAAALDSRIGAVILEQPVTTYRPATAEASSWHEWDLDMYVPHILLHADVSQVASLIAPRPLLIVDGRDMGNRSLPAADVGRGLFSCRGAYDLFDARDEMSVVAAREDLDYVTWFHQQLREGN